MRGGASSNNGYESNNVGPSNDEKKELAMLNAEMQERQAKKKEVNSKKKKANTQGRRSARGRGRGKRRVS
tara:strand:+ start:293 stop:502 length:210 start_codon:yes stop_codon:yes gene_type:complete